jgi:hypothetical protein
VLSDAELEVLEAIVGSIGISMVNLFVPAQWAAERLLHDETVLVDHLVPVPRRLPHADPSGPRDVNVRVDASAPRGRTAGRADVAAGRSRWNICCP